MGGMLTDVELAEMRRQFEIDAMAYSVELEMLNEITRLRKALEDIGDADCCGCSVYGEIASAALEGTPISIEHSATGKTYVSAV